MAQRDDGELLRRCIEGDGDAWSLFIGRFTPYLARVIETYLSRRAGDFQAVSADDVLQEIWAAFWQDDRRILRNYDGRCAVGTYLGLVAVRRLQNRISSEARVLSLRNRLQRIFAEGTADSPDASAVTREEIARLESALSELPSRDRLLLLWIRGEGMSYADAARLLNLPENSVGPFLSRAQERLKQILSK